MVKKIIKKVVKKAKVIKSPATAYDVVIIGGGPAGLMAACQAGGAGKKVLVLEKNDELGKKLLISGGGRCNLTNANPNHREFVSKYGKKGDFLFSPFSIFGVPETIKFFNDLGLETKIEPGFRVFPVSDNSADVLNILVNQAKKLGVEFKLSAEVASLSPSLDKVSFGMGSKTQDFEYSVSGKREVYCSCKEGDRGQLKNQKRIKSVVLLSGEEISAHKFILATGGMSHPETGSTGDGFKWLKEIGHKVTTPNPSLVPVKVSNPWIAELSGISLDAVGISVWVNQGGFKKVLTKKGRILFTHVGLTGPTILNMSKAIGEYLEYPNPEDGRAGGEVLISLDLFSGVGLDQMHEMMLKTFTEHINKKIKNLVFPQVPGKIFELILKQLEIDPEWEINEIRREERLALIEKFKKFELTASGLLGFDKAIITSGGLDLGEVDFKTMGSKLYDNLYFAGDILDFDRPSGGFSLQLCWTTGYIAGKSSVNGLK
jgi:predicted Rossmann fold flavoprotein